jgi:anti-anti-sigma factor
MQLTEELHSNCRIIIINGRLDTTTHAVLEKRLMDLIQAGETRFLADCRGMDYISSSGLRVFLMALKKIRTLRGRLILCSLTGNVREVFAISGFAGIFEIYPGREEALRAFEH